MKSSNRNLTTAEGDAIAQEVNEQFADLVSALNEMDAESWAGNYDADGFVSSIVGTEHYDSRSVFVDTIKKYFSLRERQLVEPAQVRVTALAKDLALMTSEEESSIWLKDKNIVRSKHVFTMIWRKGPEGWKILHSHESWLDL